MVWFKVDDGFYSSRKVLSIPRRHRLAAVGLWTMAGNWSGRELTDGKVPSYVLDELGATETLIRALVDARLWLDHRSVEPRPSLDRASTGIEFTNWAEYQPTRADVEAERAKTAERQRRWRERHKGETDDSTVSNGVTAPVTNGVSHGAPTRPDPTRKEIPTESLSSETATAPIRPEVTRLLDLLDTEIVRNGGKSPKRTKKNVDAVRLMLDRDGYTEAQIERAIRWCQADEFWRANILSASKLREKYEQLRLAAQRATHSPVAPDDKFHDTVERGRRLAALTNQGEIAS